MPKKHIRPLESRVTREVGAGFRKGKTFESTLRSTLEAHGWRPPGGTVKRVVRLPILVRGIAETQVLDRRHVKKMLVEAMIRTRFGKTDTLPKIREEAAEDAEKILKKSFDPYTRKGKK